MDVQFLKISKRKNHEIEILEELFKEYYNSLFSNKLSDDLLQTLKSFVFYDVLKNEISLKEKEYYLIFCKNAPIGFFEYYMRKNVLYLNSIYIKKEFQNKKIGSDVIKFLENFANKNDLKSIVSFVFCEFKGVLSFFRSLDFQVVKQVVKYYGSGISIYCYEVEKEL